MDFTDRVSTTTQERLLPSVVDNLLNSNILVVRTLQRPKQWDGKTLDRAIKIAKSTTGGSFGRGDVFQTGLVETRIKLSFKPKAFYQSVTLDGIEDAVNQTEMGVISLMKLTLEEAGTDAADSLGDMVYGTGAGQDFDGTGRLNDDGTTADVVGTQSRAAYPLLKGTVTALTSGLTLTDLANLMKGVGAAGSRKQRPTLGIGDEDVWNVYEGLLLPTVQANYSANGYPQVTAQTRNGQAVPEASLNGTMGFNSITYRGLPIVADEKAPAGELSFGLIDVTSTQLGSLEIGKSGLKRSEVGLLAGGHGLLVLLRHMVPDLSLALHARVLKLLGGKLLAFDDFLLRLLGHLGDAAVVLQVADDLVLLEPAG